MTAKEAAERKAEFERSRPEDEALVSLSVCVMLPLRHAIPGWLCDSWSQPSKSGEGPRMRRQ